MITRDNTDVYNSSSSCCLTTSASLMNSSSSSLVSMVPSMLVTCTNTVRSYITVLRLATFFSSRISMNPSRFLSNSLNASLKLVKGISSLMASAKLAKHRDL